MAEVALYGKPMAEKRAEGYKSPEEYADQGDTRIVRDLGFSYLVATKDTAGNDILTPVDVGRHAKLNVADIGLIGLEKGERNHSFYTTEERERYEAGSESGETPIAEQNISSMGEFELAEYIGGDNPTGKPLNVNDTLALVGDDKDLAIRMLAAENLASEGEPRKGVEVGLTAIIERSE